ncbi:phosphatidylinositol-4-phosphate 5-kinase related [Anaeramoeba ignava]|uniref:Phosphatidylinositol-4-phosphate 5-kinase related n=1 Tax=Anaeramoeba ignava TaxID=1746090 RepID=A0A9Q0LDH7_ANAIG|nr:phosphatidylinositol-4-phosphate 5-kinase related [Anaeramoeba ignava]
MQEKSNIQKNQLRNSRENDGKNKIFFNTQTTTEKENEKETEHMEAPDILKMLNLENLAEKINKKPRELPKILQEKSNEKKAIPSIRKNYNFQKKVQFPNEKLSLAYFKQFLQQQLSEENILFWEAVKQYNTILDPVERIAKAKEIIEKFIDFSSLQEINIPDLTKKQILKKVEEEKFVPDLFNDASDMIFTLMKTDSFPRFLHSNQYTELLKDRERIKNNQKPIGPKTKRDELFEIIYLHEQKYLESLNKFYETAIKPIQNELGKIIEHQIFEKIFEDILEIYSFTQTMFIDLTTRKEKWNYESCIGDFFLEKISEMSQLYQRYFSHFKIITETYKEMMKNKQFQKFVKALEFNTSAEIEKMLKIPLKKMDELRRFIKKLQEITSLDHPDKKHLVKLSTTISSLTQNIQQKKVLLMTLDPKTSEIFSQLDISRMDIGKVIEYPYNPEMNQKIIQVFLFRKTLAWCFCSRVTGKFEMDYMSSLDFVWISDFDEIKQAERKTMSFQSSSMIITKLSGLSIKTPDRYIEIEIPNKQEFITDFYNHLSLEFSYKEEDIQKNIERIFTFPYRNLTRHTGAFQNAIPVGQSQIKYPNGTIFEGMFVNGKKEGNAVVEFPTGDTLKTVWKNGVPNGESEMVDVDQNHFIGFLVDGKKDGDGKFSDVSGAFYQGEFKNNMFHGKGNVSYSDGSQFNGTFQDHSRNGFGKFIQNDTFIYEGDWENDLRKGKGKQVYQNGDIYEGEWLDDLRHGKGKFQSGIAFYEGDWQYDCKNGKGLMMWNKTKWYDGEWKNNLRHGYGVFVNGNYKYTGHWRNNLPNGKGELCYYQKNIEKRLSIIQKDRKELPILTDSNDSVDSNELNNPMIQNEQEPEILEKIVGNFLKGKPHHHVKYYISKRYRFEGEMDMGKKHGEGTLFFENGGKVTLHWNHDKPNHEQSTKMEFVSKTGIFRLNYDLSGAISENVTITSENNNTIFEKKRDENVQKINEHFGEWLLPNNLSLIIQGNWY